MLLEQAVWLATVCHKGQVRFCGEPYVWHSIRVMQQVDGDDAKIVAVLHDVPEMCGWHHELLKLPQHQIECLELLTRRLHEPYMHYIYRLSQNEMAKAIKVADIKDNLIGTTRSLRKRYDKALAFLLNST